MSKRKWRWVTRKDRARVVEIWNLYRPRPTFDAKWEEWDIDSGDSDYVTVCAAEFKKLTGITVPTDRPIKVEFSAKVVE